MDFPLIRFLLQDQKGYESLRFAWLALGTRERSSLTDHFLADGIEDPDACSLALGTQAF